MKYLESSLVSSLSGSLETSCVQKCGDILLRLDWVVIVVYVGILVGLWIWALVTYPGYDSDELSSWFSDTFTPYILNASHFTWLVLCLLSTLVTIVAITKIFGTIRRIASATKQV